jgi:predicted RNase H-like nuclease (RuvC/YqgF family)
MKSSEIISYVIGASGGLAGLYGALLSYKNKKRETFADEFESIVSVYKEENSRLREEVEALKTKNQSLYNDLSVLREELVVLRKRMLLLESK